MVPCVTPALVLLVAGDWWPCWSLARETGHWPVKGEKGRTRWGSGHTVWSIEEYSNS